MPAARPGVGDLAETRTSRGGGKGGRTCAPLRVTVRLTNLQVTTRRADMFAHDSACPPPMRVSHPCERQLMSFRSSVRVSAARLASETRQPLLRVPLPAGQLSRRWRI